MDNYTERDTELFFLIGNKLRNTREARDLTIEEVSTQTRISLQFLKKIEQGDMDGLPAIPFVKGFIRNYQQVLDLREDEELNNAINELVPSVKIDKTSKVSQPTVNVLETEEQSGGALKLGLIGLLIILLIWVGYMVISSTGDSDEAETVAGQQTESTEPAQETAPAENEGTAKAGGSDATPEAGEDTTKTESMAGAQSPANPNDLRTGVASREKLKLTIRGLEKSWVRLSIDRASPVDVWIDPAETIGWEASHEIRMTVGKSNGVAMYLNGEDIMLPSEPNRLIPNILLNKLTLLRIEN